ncbi:MAG: guanylate kinase [Bacteroidales bacterium]|jgi:guanylate kinase|nr:guanylate kinase [Bacteroidales bacterium]MDG1900631.1 guanylate kinase [Bacteroidales bacterium]MDG2081356.1 guanylate kinase [Bacteroidales bacterium]
MDGKGKLLIFSAPSGAGKTTLVRYVMEALPSLAFSISATSRQKRGNEIDGKEYYFLSVEDFRKKIANDEFVEWEEVYDDKYYGTLKSEVDRITNIGDNVVFDVDVVGGLNIKNIYGDKALAIFVMPPNIDTLDKRLINRNTDSKHDIETRIKKAKYELTFADKFDISIINDDLEIAKKEAIEKVSDFINK